MTAIIMRIHAIIVIVICMLVSRMILANKIDQKDVETCEFKTYCHMKNKSHESHIAHCEGKGEMNCIPPIPKDAKTLIIEDGSFTHITEATFKTLRNSSVSTFSMILCRIKSVDNTTFKDLKIKDLTFSGNVYPNLGPEQFAAALHSLEGSGIVNLSLDAMSWTSLPSNMFHGLIHTKIKIISLKRNLLMKIDGSIFHKLKSLRVLNLDWNPILDKENKFEGLSAIKELSLTGTWYFFFPNFCNKDNKSYVPNLEVLRLDYSKIQSLYNQIICLDNLKSLNLSGLSVRLLYDNTFSELPSLTKLYMRQMGSQFNIIRNHAFNSSSLEFLSFSVYGDFAFSDRRNHTFNATSLFQNTKSLKYLDLSYTRFTLSDWHWRQIFGPLKNLTALKLKSVKMQYLPVNIGDIFDNLKELHLQSNPISSWKNSQPFDNLKSLRFLKLSGNRISVINQSSFPQDWITGEGNLTELRLVGNPFSCSCDLAWFRQWMETFKSINLTSDADIWRCSMTHTKVLDFHPRQTFECLLVYIIPGLTGLFVCLFTSFIFYIFRFRLKLAIYRCRSRRNNYTKINENDFLYDCFVAYSYGDFQWIQDHLMPKIEDEHNRHLCIRDRDFELGTVFSTHIIENIEASKTVLLVLSEHFARDVWCNFQLDIANHLRITKDIPTIIPVMLNNISFQYINEPIYKIINASQCHVWSQDESAETLFWSAILDHIPQNDEPGTVLNHSIQTYDSFSRTHRNSIQSEF